MAGQQNTPDVSHFQRIPWCAAHLSSQNLIIETPHTRLPKPDHEEALMAQTLNRPDAIAAFAVFYTPPPSPSDLLEEVGAFLTLGPMLNGWKGICHGGIVMTILDEVCGQLAAINRARGVVKDIPMMTAYLNVKFVAPVRTGTTVLVRAWMARREGSRKYFVEGVMEDEGKRVLARAEGLFIQLKEKL
ncbi:HotDog domain-containing protein [Echria macrotheca]|uniref:HotDog domain-containing protein n=1 Tax=Echria macrotheca TaxID=438768 RepID=A0AAJ0BEK4_9PEZI|nr:HotDog domain-containing protein [Echria macrotheca]